MSKTYEDYGAVIAEDFIVAISNGEFSHLTQDDELALNEWIERYTENLDENEYITFDFNDDSYFGTDEVTGQGATVVDCTVYVWKK